MPSEPVTIEEQYSLNRPVYEAFTTNALDLIRRILAEEAIEIAAIESRTKSADSLRQKLERSGKAGKYNVLGDITDLSGLRVISFLKEDCARIVDVMRKSFVVDEANTTSKTDELDPDRFGYQSVHLILGYSPDRLKLPEFRRFSGLKFELQVKTLLQHTWSVIDWKLRYKKSTEAPRKLRRRLFRISALLDAADDELSYVYDQVSNIKKYYANEMVDGNLDLDIDRESVTVYVDRASADHGPIAKFAEKLNPKPSMQEGSDQTEVSADKLQETLKRLELPNIQSLDEILRVADDANASKVNEAVKQWLSGINSPSWSTNYYDIVRLALLSRVPADLAGVALDAAPFNASLTPALKAAFGIAVESTKAA